MPISAPISEYAETCTRIGNEIADDHGFVPVRRLLQRFGTRLQLRPLLVEAMFASLEPSPGQSQSNERWTVLMDSETYGVTPEQIEEESSRRPLPDRFRNSVAHELVHSLAFRQSEFGLHLRRGSQDLDVDDIERATEALSPLVLIPERSLVQRVRGLKRSLTVSDLMAWRRDWGVSRYVLLSRLSRLPRDHDLRQFPSLRNCASGVASWGQTASLVLHGWPLYVNFDRNVQPKFLSALAAQDQLPIEAIGCGVPPTGEGRLLDPVRWEAPAGVIGGESSESLNVTLTVEPSRNRLTARCFWVLAADSPGRS